MATPITELIPMFDREINVPNAPQVTVSASQKLGYIADGFWDARLFGLLSKYTIVDGADVVPAEPTGDNYITDISTKSKDLDQQFWMMVVIFAGFRLLRLKVMELAVNFKAEAGPVSFEQQASATVLRALLDNLQRRIDELKMIYSDQYGSAFYLMDGMAQAEYSYLNLLSEQQIIY
jgi:hypothetical protein